MSHLWVLHGLQTAEGLSMGVQVGVSILKCFKNSKNLKNQKNVLHGSS